ncbi:MAG: hypothetical protein HY079_01035, partial [Elusimicrobia bacterium]|nr:hypothetical protein [Elusimicrobiota bacterium]
MLSLALLLAAPAGAARLAVVEKAAVEVVVAPSARAFSGVETLSLRAPDGGADAVALDAAGLTLEGPRPRGGGAWDLPRALAPGATGELRVGFRGGAEAGLAFAGGWVYSRGDDEGGGRWFPRPAGARPLLSVTVVVPEGWSAASNGVLVSSGPDAFPGNARFAWESAVPVPPALAALYAGPFARVALASAPVVVEAWVPEGREAAARAAFASAPALLARFADAFGAPYPWPRLTLAAVPRPPNDGYEFAGAPRFDARVLDGGFGEVVAHELVHQWFGAWVAPPSPADAWLSEALASYFAAPDPLALDAKARAAFAAEARAPRALAGSPPGAQSYGRGVWFLRVLRAEAGGAAFAAAVRRFARERGGRSGGPADLRAAL